MSRIGKQPIEIPSGVDVKVGEDAVVVVKGPRGELTQRVHPEMRLVRDEGVLRVERPTDEGVHPSPGVATPTSHSSATRASCASNGRPTRGSTAACTGSPVR